jgi:hypothetical protein
MGAQPCENRGQTERFPILLGEDRGQAGQTQRLPILLEETRGNQKTFRLSSIFQSKNDTEIDFRSQRKMILKWQGRTGGRWPFSCVSGGSPEAFVLVFVEESRIRRSALRGGVGETAVWFSTLPCGAAPGGGNVGISPFLRDFQGAGGRGGNLFVVSHAFHRPVISTALSWRLH